MKLTGRDLHTLYLASRDREFLRLRFTGISSGVGQTPPTPPVSP